MGLLLFNDPLSVNRQWTGMLSWPKRWNLPSCRSSKHRRTSVTLTRSSHASSQSSPSHEHPASSPPSSRKSLLTLTSPSWVDQWDFLWQEAPVQTYFYLPQHPFHSTEAEKLLSCPFHTVPHFQLHTISVDCLLKHMTVSSIISLSSAVTLHWHTLSLAGSDFMIYFHVSCPCQIHFELFNEVRSQIQCLHSGQCNNEFLIVHLYFYKWPLCLWYSKHQCCLSTQSPL